MKDKRRWTLTKTYGDFASLKAAFPVFTTWFFSSRFPLPTLDMFLLSSHESLERRRRMLEEWIRELVLNEVCMSQPAVLDAIYAFIEADRHGGRCTIETVMKQQQATSIVMTNRMQSCHMRHTNRVLTGCFPLKLEVCMTSLPFRVNCKEFAEVQTTQRTLFQKEGAGGDFIDQLKKDLKRDRIIIQGKRFLGSQTGYDDLNNFCIDVFQEIVNFRLNSSGGSSSSGSSSSSSSSSSSLQNRDNISSFCTSNLRYASRTESAFIAHQMLLNSVETMAAEALPLLIVPESMLSEPLVVNFRLMEKDGDESKWCIACDVEAAACFRLVAANEAMDVALQLKITYCKTMYALHGEGDGVFTEKEGACFVVFDKETLTTKRDWK